MVDAPTDTLEQTARAELKEINPLVEVGQVEDFLASSIKSLSKLGATEVREKISVPDLKTPQLSAQKMELRLTDRTGSVEEQNKVLYLADVASLLWGAGEIIWETFSPLSGEELAEIETFAKSSLFDPFGSTNPDEEALEKDLANNLTGNMEELRSLADQLLKTLLKLKSKKPTATGPATASIEGVLDRLKNDRPDTTLERWAQTIRPLLYDFQEININQSFLKLLRASFENLGNNKNLFLISDIRKIIKTWLEKIEKITEEKESLLTDDQKEILKQATKQFSSKSETKDDTDRDSIRVLLKKAFSDSIEALAKEPTKTTPTATSAESEAETEGGEAEPPEKKPEAVVPKVTPPATQIEDPTEIVAEYRYLSQGVGVAALQHYLAFYGLDVANIPPAELAALQANFAGHAQSLLLSLSAEDLAALASNSPGARFAFLRRLIDKVRLNPVAIEQLQVVVNNYTEKLDKAEQATFKTQLAEKSTQEEQLENFQTTEFDQAFTFSPLILAGKGNHQQSFKDQLEQFLTYAQVSGSSTTELDNIISTIDSLISLKYSPRFLETLDSGKFALIFGIQFPPNFFADEARKKDLIGLLFSYWEIRRAELASIYGDLVSDEWQAQDDQSLDAISRETNQQFSQRVKSVDEVRQLSSESVSGGEQTVAATNEATDEQKDANLREKTHQRIKALKQRLLTNLWNEVPEELQQEMYILYLMPPPPDGSVRAMPAQFSFSHISYITPTPSYAVAPSPMGAAVATPKTSRFDRFTKSAVGEKAKKALKSKAMGGLGKSISSVLSKAHPALAAASVLYSFLPDSTKKKINNALAFIGGGLAAGTTLLISNTISALGTVGGFVGGVVGGVGGFLVAGGPVGILPGVVVGANAGAAISSSVSGGIGGALSQATASLGSGGATAAGAGAAATAGTGGFVATAAALSPVAAAGLVVVMNTVTQGAHLMPYNADGDVSINFIADACWPTDGTISGYRTYSTDGKPHAVWRDNIYGFRGPGVAIDISTGNKNPKVVSPFSGVANFWPEHTGLTATSNNYGNHVVVTTPQFLIVFAHMRDFAGGISNTKPTNDVPIAAGTVLGTVDNTGNSDGEHLHYETIGTDVLNILPLTSSAKTAIRRDESEIFGLPVSISQCEDVEGGIKAGGRGYIAISPQDPSNLVASTTTEISRGSSSTCLWGGSKGLAASINANFINRDQSPVGLAGLNPVEYFSEPDTDPDPERDYSHLTPLLRSFVVTNTNDFQIIQTGKKSSSDPRNMTLAVTGLDTSVVDLNKRPRVAVGLGEANSKCSIDHAGQNVVMFAALKSANLNEIEETLKKCGATQIIHLDGGRSTAFCQEGNALIQQAQNVPVNIGMKEAEIVTVESVFEDD